MSTVLPAVMFVLGLAAITVGAGLIYLPAGLIVGGVLAAGSASLYVRGSTAPVEAEQPPQP